MPDRVAYWVAGAPAHGTEPLTVRSPYRGALAGVTSYAPADDVERAIAAAAAVAPEFARWSAHDRAAALEHVSRRLDGLADEIAALITAETGKPIQWSRLEVARAAATFRWSAEEARRFSGQLQRLDTDRASTGRLALVRRVPRGPVLAITPFNFPLNLVAHKLAPALAVGAPVVVKPAPAAPLTALLLGEILAETPLPPGSWSVLTVPDADMEQLVTDDRLPVVSFTGSGPVGWGIKDRVPRKHVILELGGNAAALICPDWTDLDQAAGRIARFGNYQAGQSCIAVQRVFLDRPRYEAFLDLLGARVRELATGDPADPATEVGPLINEAAARRVESWVAAAVSAGARLITGGTREGATVTPTVLADVPESAQVNQEEVFGPVLVVAAVDSVAEGLARINNSRYGLQAGVFTHDLGTAFTSAATLEVGGVVVGDVPSYRAEQMPYGGVKDSGVGREGVRAAIDDLTDTRVLVLTGITL